MQDCKVSILGTEYAIQKKGFLDEPAFEERRISGYCDRFQKMIIYCNLDTDKSWEKEPEKAKREAEKTIVRHEITHAFLFESGIAESAHITECGWGTDEEIVDWVSSQLSKIYEACVTAGAI